MTNVSRETYGAEHFFNLSNVWFSRIFQETELPWQLLAPKFKEGWIRSQIKANVSTLRRKGSLVQESVEIPAKGGNAVVEAGSYVVGDDIELRAGAVIEAGSWVTGPTILGEGTVVRHGAYVRGGVMTGERVVLGHASEIKSSIFLNDAKAPHFAYVGDSILGNDVNLGAGTKVSNLKITNDEVILRIEKQPVRSGLRKFGAIIGDSTQTGCNSVLNPGVLLAPRCLVYPCSAVRKDYYGVGSIIR